MTEKKLGKCYVFMWNNTTMKQLKCNEFIDRIENKKYNLTFIKSTKPLYLENKKKRVYFAYEKIAYTIPPYDHYEFLKVLSDENNELTKEIHERISKDKSLKLTERNQLKKDIVKNVTDWLKENPETITRNNDTAFITGFQKSFRDKFTKFLPFIPLLCYFLGIITVVLLGYFNIISVGIPPEPYVIIVPQEPVIPEQIIKTVLNGVGFI